MPRSPDLVHLHSRRGADTWGGLAAKLAGALCAAAVDNLNRASPWPSSTAFRCRPRHHHLGGRIRQVLLDEGLPAAKVTCVRSAVDPEPFLPYGPGGLPRRVPLCPRMRLVAGVAQMILKGYRHLFRGAA